MCASKLVVDILFVHLKKPPHMVKFDGLPENVVPIAKMSQTITAVCRMCDTHADF